MYCWFPLISALMASVADIVENSLSHWIESQSLMLMSTAVDLFLEKSQQRKLKKKGEKQGVFERLNLSPLTNWITSDRNIIITEKGFFLAHDTNPQFAPSRNVITGKPPLHTTLVQSSQKSRSFSTVKCSLQATITFSASGGRRISNQGNQTQHDINPKNRMYDRG